MSLTQNHGFFWMTEDLLTGQIFPILATQWSPFSQNHRYRYIPNDFQHYLMSVSEGRAEMKFQPSRLLGRVFRTVKSPLLQAFECVFQWLHMRSVRCSTSPVGWNFSVRRCCWGKHNTFQLLSFLWILFCNHYLAKLPQNEIGWQIMIFYN